jgi:membrane associated rhomboid family serine protease
MFFLPIGDENPARKVPYVTFALLAVNVLVFLGLGFTSLYGDIVRQFGYIPSKAVPFTFLTSLFLHGSIFHLLGNMLYLYIVGDNVEDKLGHAGFLAFYLVTGAAANLIHGHMASGRMLDLPTIGASGAISAVLAAYLLMFPRNKIKYFYFIFVLVFIRWGTFSLASFWAIGLWFLMQLFSHAFSGGYSSVAYGAHIGGFLAGFLILGFLVLTGRIAVFWHKEQDYMDIAREEEPFPPALSMESELPINVQHDAGDGTYRVTGFHQPGRKDDRW